MIVSFAMDVYVDRSSPIEDNFAFIRFISLQNKISILVNVDSLLKNLLSYLNVRNNYSGNELALGLECRRKYYIIFPNHYLLRLKAAEVEFTFHTPNVDKILYQSGTGITIYIYHFTQNCWPRTKIRNDYWYFCWCSYFWR